MIKKSFFKSSPCRYQTKTFCYSEKAEEDCKIWNVFVEPSLADKLAKDGTYHKWMLAQVKSGNKDALKVFFLNFVFYLKKVFIKMSFFF